MRIIFCTEDDDGRLTQYYEVEVEFDQSRPASHNDQNLIGGQWVMSKRYKRSFKWTSHFSNVLFLCVGGGCEDPAANKKSKHTI